MVPVMEKYPVMRLKNSTNIPADSVSSNPSGSLKILVILALQGRSSSPLREVNYTLISTDTQERICLGKRSLLVTLTNEFHQVTKVMKRENFLTNRLDGCFN